MEQALPTVIAGEIGSTLRAALWPIVALCIALIFRTELASLLRNARSVAVSTPAGSVSVSEAARAAALIATAAARADMADAATVLWIDRSPGRDVRPEIAALRALGMRVALDTDVASALARPGAATATRAVVLVAVDDPATIAADARRISAAAPRAAVLVYDTGTNSSRPDMGQAAPVAGVSWQGGDPAILFQRIAASIG